MRALADEETDGTEPAVETEGRGLLHGLVLPRFLRRPVRALERLNLSAPRHIGVKAAIIFFAGTAIAGMLIGGHGMTVVSALTAWSGLAITEVRITGQSETSEVDVLDHLAIGRFPSLLTYDVDAAKARVELLPWVSHAALKKLFPNTLEVEVVERTPFAIWQHDAEISFIDNAGRVITDRVGERYARLPFVAGPGAAARAAEFVALTGAFPAIAGRVRAGVLVAGRRWNVVLDNGMELLLPEKEPAAALAAIADLDSNQGLLSREIAAVDFRVAGEMVVRLTDEGVAARKAMLKARDKLAKRGRTNT